jgi:D-alanine-D-alanine ligase
MLTKLRTKSKNKNQSVGIIYDVPKKLINTRSLIFPDDATAEWETKKTIQKIIETWKQLGFFVILFPLDQTFLKKWKNKSASCSFVHSVAEGWGSLGREAWIPSLCELSGIPFLGSGPFAQSVCLSKSQTKFVCQFLNIPTAPFWIIKHMKDFEKIPAFFFKETHFIKPDGEGSGMGICASFSISNSQSNTKKIVAKLLKKYTQETGGILLEKYLDGEEYTSALIGSSPEFLPIAHIEVPDGVYGLANKSKEQMGEKVTFPKISPHKEKIIKQGSEKIFHFLNMKDFVRIDWRCDKQGNTYFLEANTLPGLSADYSVLPLMAKEHGLNYQEFFWHLAQSVLARGQTQNLWYGKTRLQK